MTWRFNRSWLLGIAGGSLVAVAGGLFALGLAGCSRSAASQTGEATATGTEQGPTDKPLRVRTIRPTRERLHRTTTQPAMVEPYEKINIHAKISGYVSKLGQIRGDDGKLRDVDLGDRVEKDQLLVELAVPELVQDFYQKEAMLKLADAGILQAEAAVKSAGAMVGAAQAKLEQARAEVKRAESEAAYRKGESDRYQRMLADRTIQPDLAAERLNQSQAAIANLTGAKANLSLAEANHRLAESKEAEARADAKSAEARRQVALADREHARAMALYATIRAPFPGVLIRRQVDVGTFVQSATSGMPVPLFTLVSVDRLRIRVDIPEADSSWVRMGQAATLQVDSLPGQIFNGTIARHADALDPSTRTLHVEIELTESPKGVRAGMFGRATIILADFPDAILLPTSVLVSSGTKPAVFVVRDGKAHRQEIKLGMNDGIRMQVVEGLKTSDAIISDGKNAVREGQSIEIAP